MPASSRMLYEELGAQHRLLKHSLGFKYVKVAAAVLHGFTTPFKNQHLAYLCFIFPPIKTG